MEKNTTYRTYVLWVALAIVLTMALAAINPGETVTGYATSVKYYGVSNYPLSSQSGKIQTYIKLTQPTISELHVSGVALDVANKITSTADLVSGFVGAVQGDPPYPIPTSGLDAVISGSNALTTKFKEDTQCLSDIGQMYQNYDELELVMVTEPVWMQCWYYDDWNAYKARHTYYTMRGTRLCSQDSPALFTQKQVTGEISTSTYGC